jgi:hypothetical protein
MIVGESIVVAVGHCIDHHQTITVQELSSDCQQ